MKLLRPLQLFTAAALLILIAASLRGCGLDWTSYTPTTTQLHTIPLWPFAFGLGVLLSILVLIEHGTRGTK